MSENRGNYHLKHHQFGKEGIVAYYERIVLYTYIYILRVKVGPIGRLKLRSRIATIE